MLIKVGEPDPVHDSFRLMDAGVSDPDSDRSDGDSEGSGLLYI